MNFLKAIALCGFAGMLHAPSTLTAQELPMTIDELLERVESHNTEVKVARRAVEISTENEKCANAKRLPDIGVSAALNFLGDATVFDRNFTHATRSAMPHFGNSLSLSVYQPLYAGGEINAQIDKTRRQTEMAENAMEQTADRMKMSVLECYLNLFKHRNLLAVYDENISLTHRLLDEMKARAGQGVVLGNDVTRYELNLSNQNYDRMTVADGIEHLNRSLQTYLGLHEHMDVIPDLHPESMELPAMSLDRWKELTETSSPELKELNLRHALSQTEEQLIRSRTLPKIGMTAGDDFNGPITSRSPVVNKNLNSWWVGMKLTYSLSSLYKESSALKAARMVTGNIPYERKARKEAIERQLDQAYRLYTEACELVRTQLKNVELATENYRIVERRYSNDLSLLTDMLDASASKLDAEVRLVNARTNVIYYYYQLKYISGTL